MAAITLVTKLWTLLCFGRERKAAFADGGEQINLISLHTLSAQKEAQDEEDLQECDDITDAHKQVTSPFKVAATV